jgi:hypothetical protein
MVAAAGCGGGQEQGASAPPQAGTLSAAPGAGGGPTAGGSTPGGQAAGGTLAASTISAGAASGGSAGAGGQAGAGGASGAGGAAPAGPDGSGGSGPAVAPSARGPLDVITAYFAAINAAGQAGTAADVSAVAVDGCQTCALDINMTEQFASRGTHTDSPPYAVSDLTLVSDNGLSASARLTVTLRAYRELTAQGAVADTVPAGGPRTGTATVTYTPSGWRLQNILYSAGD